MPTTRQSPLSPWWNILPYSLFALALVAVAYAAVRWVQVGGTLTATATATSVETLEEPLPPLEDFTLTRHDGQPLRSGSLRGTVWVASFFFTRCPGACPEMNRNIAAMSRDRHLEEVAWVSISCDPSRDDLPALADYAEQFQADPDRWHVCRAPLETVQRAGEQMGMAVLEQSHQTYAVVIDRQGRPRGVFQAAGTQSQLDELQDCLQQVLAEPSISHP